MEYTSIEKLLALFDECNGICRDTRKVAQQSMFFALSGPQFNANKFATEALAKGCKYAVVDNADFAKGDRIFLVEDALKAFQDLANAHRKRFSIPFIGITGSNGKTTTKELMRDVLAKKYKVLATKGNLNNHIGVPSTLLEVDKQTEIAIIEMGANHQREIAALCAIANPDYGFITNIGLAHLEGFGGKEGVKKGKKELFDFLAEHDGRAFIPQNDPVLVDISSHIAKRSFFSGPNAESLLRLELQQNDGHTPTGSYRLKTNSEDRTFSCHLTGTYNASNMAAAMAVGLYFNVSEQSIVDAISSYLPENSRSQITKSDRNTIINDAYNANPSSMEHAVENLMKMKGSPLAILADMKELGEESHNYHQLLVDKLDLLECPAILIGEAFKACSSIAQQLFFDCTEDALAHLKSNAPSGRIILLKGSNSMNLASLLPAL